MGSVTEPLGRHGKAEKRRKVFLYGCLCAVLLLFGMRFLMNLTDPRYGYDTYREYRKDIGRYEVLFFGNSHLEFSAYPMELWRDYGIVSFNMAGRANPLSATYWRLINALNDENPKLVVIDCFTLCQDKQVEKEYLHLSMDPMPMTGDKMRMICDLMEEPGDQLEFIWNFAIYHERWQDLSQTDFETKVSTSKGGREPYNAVLPTEEMAEKPDEAVKVTSEGMEYLRMMIEECQRRNIDVLLTYVPFPPTEMGWQEALCMEQIAEEYGIPCINFLDLEIVDFETDCSDKNFHLNASGGRKVTKYLGQYLTDHYDLKDHRGETEYASWDEDYRQYTASKLETMAEMESLDNMLVMLADPSFDCCIYVNGEADIWRQNELYQPLLENIAGWRTEKLAQAVAQGSDYLLAVENQEGRVFEAVDDEVFSEECSLGKLSYEIDENGEKCLILEDRTGRKASESIQESAAVTVFVMDNKGDGTVRTKCFTVDKTIITEKLQ